MLISQGFNEYSHYEVILLRRLTTPALRHVADTLFILALVIGLALAARPLYASSALPIPSALPASEPGGKGKANDQGQDKKGLRHMPEGRGWQPAQ